MSVLEKLGDTNPKKKKQRYRDIHGTTRVGDFLRKIKGVAPEILDLAGKVTGIGGLSVLAGKIEDTDTLSQEDKELALKELEYDMIDAQEVTKRWTSDMTSDSWLSKNVRPLIVMFLTVMMSVYIIIDSSTNGFEVKEDWISLLSSLLLLVYGAYFGGRSLEKIQMMRKK